MPGGLPLGFEVCNGQAFLNAGDGLTAPASNNTKGAYFTVIDPLPMDVCWAEFVLSAAFGGAANAAVDIAVGSAGNEKVIVNNLMISNGSSVGSGGLNFFEQLVSFPISIPAGVRVSARQQTNNLSTNFLVALQAFFYDGAFTMMEGASGVDALGITTTSATAGTTVTPDAGGGLGAYAQIISATARDYIGLFVMPDAKGNSGTLEYYNLDVAIGSSGNEKIIIPQINAGYDGLGWMSPKSGFIPVQIPSGTRIAVRTDGGGDASQPAYGVTVYGVYQ